MKHKLFYSSRSLEDLESLERGVRGRILKKLVFFVSQEDPVKYAKKLRNKIFGMYRFQIGEYRVFFDLDGKGQVRILKILRVKHRKEAYRF